MKMSLLFVLGFLISFSAHSMEVRSAPVERLPLLELILHVPGAGYRQDPVGRSGTAALLRAVLDGGDLARQCERVGAVRSSDLDADGMTFRIQGFAADRAALVDLLWRWVFAAPALEGGSGLAATQALLAERYSHLSDDPEAWALAALNTQIWRGTPSERGPIAAAAELKQVTLEELRSFHAQNLRPQSAQLWVLGNADALPAVREQMAGLEAAFPAREVAAPVAVAQKTAKQPAPKRPVRASGEPEILDRRAQGPALLYWGSRLSRPAASDVAAFWVANALLGEGSSSRLVRRIRDAGGIAYAVQSGFQFQREGWVWLVSAAAPAQTALVLLKRLKAAVAELRRGPIEAEEFRTAQESALGKLKLLRATPRSWVYRSLDVAEMDALFKAIPQVRVEDVLRVLNHAWAEAQPSVVIVGDAAAIRKGADKSKDVAQTQ